MKKIVKERINTNTNIPSWDELINLAPYDIKIYIDRCKDTPQSPEWHPEGSCFVHTRIVYDRASATGDINLALAAFFHDLGKPDTTAQNNKGGWGAHGHENISKRIAISHSDWISEMGGDPEEVIEIVAQHMRVKQMDKMKGSKKQIMRNNPYYDKLIKFTEFDSMKTLTKDELNRYK